MTFALDGTSYEIDLGQENVQRLHDALSEFVKKARRVVAVRDEARGGCPLDVRPRLSR